MAEYDGIELPRLTMALADKRDAAQRGTGRDRWRAEWAFLKETIGEDELSRRVGAGRLDDADVAALDALTARVCMAYDEPVAEAQREQIAQRLDAIGTEQVAGLTALVDAMGKLDRLTRRQGFKGVA